MIKRIKHKNKNKFYVNDVEVKNKNRIKIFEEKFKELRIPPAYISVELDPSSKSVIAKCVDESNRKQYIYHPDFVNTQKRLKYCSLIEFGKKLPEIRKKLDNELKDSSNNDKKKFLIAVILKIILECNFRIGNEKYKKLYNSHGISTIGNKHVNGSKIEFIGKKGVENKCTLNNPKIIKIVNKLKRNKDPYLFSYNGNRVSSEDINEYLQQFGDFTSKYFRTWAANTNFIREVNGKKMDKKSLKEAVSNVAVKLNHTPAVCKKSYIYPDIVEHSMNHEINTNNPEKYLISFIEKRCN